jgi:hypothetical protein
MANPKDQFRIKLTPEQKMQVRDATGKDAEARIAPIKLPVR